MRAADGPGSGIGMTLVGGPTVLIEYAGLRLLTDPTFDAPGEYAIGQRVLRKLTGPALEVPALGRIDAVLLSHHQHPDNLDRSGRAFLANAPVVFTTIAAAEALGGSAVGLEQWQSRELPGGEAPLTVTAVPARHGPPGCEPLTGAVSGFVVRSAGYPTLYVSGDNAALEAVEATAARFSPIGVALLFAGAARTPLLDGYLTLTSAQAAEAARLLGGATVVPVHLAGWAHFTEGPDLLHAAFDEAGLAERLVPIEPGERVVMGQ